MTNDGEEYRGYLIIWEVRPVSGTDFWTGRAVVVMPAGLAPGKMIHPLDGSYFRTQNQAIDYVVERAKDCIDEMIEDGKLSSPRAKKILVVEDQPNMRRLLSIELSLMGFEPITARNGREGVDKVIFEKPDLVLLDITMPEMDGREAARILRARPDTKHIPIIAATALFRRVELNSCLEAGCNDYLIKPYTHMDLEKKLRAFI
jgi:CheY-like chemotaxis protein